MIENPTDRIVAEAIRAIRDGAITEDLVARLIGEIRDLDRLWHTETAKCRELRQRLQNSPFSDDRRGLDGDPRDKRVPQRFTYVEGVHDR